MTSNTAAGASAIYTEDRPKPVYTFSAENETKTKLVNHFRPKTKPKTKVIIFVDYSVILRQHQQYSTISCSTFIAMSSLQRVQALNCSQKLETLRRLRYHTGWLHTKMVYPFYIWSVTHPSTNRTRRWSTSLMRPTTLPTKPNRHSPLRRGWYNFVFLSTLLYFGYSRCYHRVLCTGS